MKALALFASLTLFCTAAKAEPALDAAAVDRLFDYLFQTENVHTDGLVVARRGDVLIERYNTDGGFSVDTPHIAWSVSKSALQALVGIAVRDGKLSLDEPVAKYLPGRHEALKIHDLLEMSSCVEWAETYEGVDFTRSSVLAMLYGRGRRDMVAFVTAKPLVCEPGSQWEYASGTSVELMAVLKAVYGDEYATMPWTSLFDPLGMTSAVWETDTAGTYVGSSYLYATPRDLARLGQLYLQDGVWNGKRLLPEGWVKYTATPVPALVRPDTTVNVADGIQGPHWWTNAPIPTKGIKSSWTAAPSDMFAALGHWGQAIYVIPSLDLVISRTGNDREESAYNDNEMLRLILAAVKAPAPQGLAPAVPTGVNKERLHETPYWSIPGLSSAFVSKELCSCLFVMGRSEQQCAEYAHQSPMFATYTIDWERKIVRAALKYASVGGHGLFPSEVRYRDSLHGCGFAE